ncbi:MAG: hypothetical protein AAFQ89_06670 [Cyanobacteria bacterium J06626_18]
MLLLILVVVIALVAWALRLMEQAIQSQEFSFMLAGFLVASSAAAMMAVYFLANHYLVYMDHTAGIVSQTAAIPYDLVDTTSFPGAEVSKGVFLQQQ